MVLYLSEQESKAGGALNGPLGLTQSGVSLPLSGDHFPKGKPCPEPSP